MKNGITYNFTFLFYVQHLKQQQQQHHQNTRSYLIPIFLLVFNFHPHASPMRETYTSKERCIYLPSIKSRGCINWYRFYQPGIKTTPVVLPKPTIQGLAEDKMCVS